MQNPLYELDFSQIDLSNPFAITECSSPVQPQNPSLSLSSSVIYLQESTFNTEEPQSIKKKNNRGRKVDDFDYNTRIKEELEKIGEKVNDPQSKKKLIQKIRNKLSANRSRLRSKDEMKTLRNENTALKEMNEELRQQMESFANENKKLIEKLFKDKSLNSEIKTDFEDESIIRENSKGEKGHFKNLFFITAILLTISLFPSISQDNVKISGVVPLLSLKKPLQKLKKSTITEFCNKNNLNDKKCMSPKRYLYKLKQQINKHKNRILSDQTSLPQFKVKDFMNEVISYTCYNSNDKKNERVFLFDKEFLENVSGNTELHYVSETWPVEHMNN